MSIFTPNHFYVTGGTVRSSNYTIRVVTKLSWTWKLNERRRRWKKKTCSIGKELTIVEYTSTTPSCSELIRTQNIWGNSVPGAILSHTMPKMDFHHSHRFSWEINTLNWYITCHGYINIHHSPFIGPIKINRTFWKITPLGSWRSWNEMYLFSS